MPLEITMLNGEPLIFMHVPKTAGTTLTTFLDQQFDREQICPHEVIHQAHLYTREQFQGYKLIRGHLNYDHIEGLLSPGRLITVLREPIARTISQYRFFRREGEGLRKQYPGATATVDAAMSQSLEQFLRNPTPEVRHHIDNMQTRQSAGYGFAFNPAAGDEAILSRAMENLRRFDLVGLTEALPQTLELLCWLYAWYAPPQVEQLNQAPPQEDFKVTGAEYELLHELNRLDLRLYAAWRERFWEQYNRHRCKPASSATSRASTSVTA